MCSKKSKSSPVIRLSQEAADRLEAETIRKSVRTGKVLTKGEVSSALILEHFPPVSAPLMDKHGEQDIGHDNTDTNGN